MTQQSGFLKSPDIVSVRKINGCFIGRTTNQRNQRRSSSRNSFQNPDHRKVLEAARKLQTIGCFCIGVNQVDLKTATNKGIAVFNAPYSNTRSVAELVIAASIMLIRRIPDKNKAAHEGIWMKDAKGSYELRGKTLGCDRIWKYRLPG